LVWHRPGFLRALIPQQVGDSASYRTPTVPVAVS
jgi:hypothetical protein